MDYFNYKNNELFCEDVSLADIAKEFGTPCFVYSKKTITRHYKAFADSFGNRPYKICYAVKANSNLAILKLLASLGSGFDIVSGGELSRVLKAAPINSGIVFAGVGKTVDEIKFALKSNIFCFNIESHAELIRINEVAQELNLIAPIAFRVNPDVDAKSHPYISTGLKTSKFGVDYSDAKKLYALAKELPNIKIQGIACHIGSQLTSMQPFCDAFSKMLSLIDELDNPDIEYLDFGGGLGVRYENEEPPLPKEYVSSLLELLQGRNLKLILEPGRAIMANAGILLTKVEYVKNTPNKNFLIVDAAMNDLLRPSLYSSYQTILEVKESHSEKILYDVVGGVCETGDFFGKDRKLFANQDDLIAIRAAGAYGSSMSSNYNSRPRVVEVLVDGDKVDVIKHRETYEMLYQNEIVS